MVELLKRIPRQSRYKMLRHAEVTLLESTTSNKADARSSKRWHTVAKADDDNRTFLERIESSLATKKKNTIFTSNAAKAAQTTSNLIALTTAHIEQNLVRVGKKYYRQKTGIPQGSILSSTLCNYFYADLERNHLSFLQQGEKDCLLLRLIDDFMLITTDENKARRFVGVMHRGLPQYGVAVNAEKSLANFPLTVQGTAVPQPEDGRIFPYCGLLIDCETLAVTKQRDGPKSANSSKKAPSLANSPFFHILTTDNSRFRLPHSRVLPPSRPKLHPQSHQYAPSLSLSLHKQTHC